MDGWIIEERTHSTPPHPRRRYPLIEAPVVQSKKTYQMWRKPPFPRLKMNTLQLQTCSSNYTVPNISLYCICHAWVIAPSLWSRPHEWLLRCWTFCWTTVLTALLISLWYREYHCVIHKMASVAQRQEVLQQDSSEHSINTEQLVSSAATHILHLVGQVCFDCEMQLSPNDPFYYTLLPSM